MKWILIIYSVFITIKFLIYKASMEGFIKYVVNRYNLDDVDKEVLQECTRDAIRNWFKK